MGRIRLHRPIAAFACALAALTAAASADSPATAPQTATVRIGPDSGLPVPRFVALKENRVNGRRRADARAPIDWIYQRPGLPLMVTAEAGSWRRVRDPAGGEVWIHATSLDNRATVYVRGGSDGEATLRRQPSSTARPMAILEQGVVAEVMSCEADWLRVRVNDRTGWVRARDVWGAASCRDH
jgi:SH3-like domain-containing protein